MYSKKSCASIMWCGLFRRTINHRDTDSITTTFAIYKLLLPQGTDKGNEYHLLEIIVISHAQANDNKSSALPTAQKGGTGTTTLLNVFHMPRGRTAADVEDTFSGIVTELADPLQRQTVHVLYKGHKYIRHSQSLSK